MTNQDKLNRIGKAMVAEGYTREQVTTIWDELNEKSKNEIEALKRFENRLVIIKSNQNMK